MGLSGRLARGGTQLAFWWQTLASRDTGTQELSLSGLRWSLQVPCSGPCSGKEGIQGVDEQNYRIMPSFTVNLPYLEKSLKADENLCRKTNRPSRAAISPPDLQASRLRFGEL